jgi:hypothetical protein
LLIFVTIRTVVIVVDTHVLLFWIQTRYINARKDIEQTWTVTLESRRMTKNAHTFESLIGRPVTGQLSSMYQQYKLEIEQKY